MKTLITIAFILISSVCYGQEVKVEFDQYTKWGGVKVKTACVSGYLFAVAKVPGNNGVAITQIFEGGQYHSSPSRPIKCKG